MRRRRLSEKQLAAVRILANRGQLPLTEGATTEKAINRTTAWSLAEKGIARHGYTWRSEWVKLTVIAQQLVEIEMSGIRKGR